MLGNWYEVSSLDVTGWVSVQPLRENLHEAQVELQQFFKNGSFKTLRIWNEHTSA
jgi:hypothetical protein